jgi:hypothetical protein
MDPLTAIYMSNAVKDRTYYGDINQDTTFLGAHDLKNWLQEVSEDAEPTPKPAKRREKVNIFNTAPVNYAEPIMASSIPYSQMSAEDHEL